MDQSSFSNYDYYSTWKTFFKTGAASVCLNPENPLKKTLISLDNDDHGMYIAGNNQKMG